jgi:hypothetical protein
MQSSTGCTAETAAAISAVIALLQLLALQLHVACDELQPCLLLCFPPVLSLSLQHRPQHQSGDGSMATMWHFYICFSAHSLHYSPAVCL